jgi:FAD/FMN-containing dehydrogenase
MLSPLRHPSTEEAPVPADAAVQELEKNLLGELVRPDDRAYDPARKIWNGMIDRRPALIVRCLGTSDVIAGVRFAREHGLTVAVRGGGHNIAGKCVCDDGLLLDFSLMKGVQVDPARRTARAQAGAKLGGFDRETQAFGLATTMGVATDTGVSGLTLGGGYGWLDGKYGLACDNLTSAQVVTAEGTVLTVNDSENPDLFWAIRGGGGNFGIVTSLEFCVHPVGPVLGGAVFYPLSIAKQALRVFHEFSSMSPDDVTTMPVGIPAPDGTPTVAIAVCYSGPLEKGESLLKPLRTLGPALMDVITPRSYVEMQSMFDVMFTPGRRYYWKSSLLREVGEDAIDRIIEHTRKMPTTPGTFIYLQQLHGAAGRVGDSETAFPHRYDHYNCGAMAGWDSPADTEKNISWSRDFWQAMQPFYERSAYVNDLGDEDEQRIREAYGVNYERLVEIKTKYDPTNFFRLNQNIVPRSAAAV